MKQRLTFALALVLLIAIFATCLTACSAEPTTTLRDLLGYKTEDVTPDLEPESPYLPLYDDDGLYLEENFAYNMALEKENGVALIKDGTTDYVIVTATEIGQDITWAAEDLAVAFEEICGTKPQIVTDETPATPHEIVLGGNTSRFEATVGSEVYGAYRIITEGEKIYIFGEDEMSTANGVYSFMEDTLGCVFLSNDETYYPALKVAIVEPINNVWAPDFEYRDVGFQCVWSDSHFENKLRGDTSAFSSDGCHKSLGYIASDVLAEHPEYYALLGGKRQSGDYMFQGPQLCFSNPDVIDLLEEAIIDRIESSNTDKEFWWDISQQDSMNLCQCDRCLELCREYQSNIAPMLYCLNIIATRHPEYKFSTLSYHYGSTPPTGVEIADNLMIKWCIMSSFGRNDYAAPLYDCESSIATQQYNEIVGWSKLTSNLFVWDYITDYFNYVLPFPCLSAMQGNIQLLRDCNVMGILSLGSHNNRGSQDYLKANYAAHLLWDADINSKEFIGKFLTVYFGKDAAKSILKLYMAEEEYVSAPLCVYDWPSVHKNDYLSQDHVNEYFGYLDEAFKATEGNETYQKRLRYERLCLLYAKLSLGYFEASEKQDLKDEFQALCEEFDITRINEIGTFTVSDFLADL